MFERFTERARQVITLAQEEARGFEHAEIGTGHLLLGLFRENDGVGARVLRECGAEEAAVRTKVKDLYPKAQEGLSSGGMLRFTAASQKALELGLREALSLGQNYVGTEHVLLGLVREGGASELLSPIEPSMIRDAVVLVARGHHARRNAARWEEYVICKKRGHEKAAGEVSPFHAERSTCRHCGTSYWTETVVRESGAPVDPATSSEEARA